MGETIDELKTLCKKHLIPIRPTKSNPIYTVKFISKINLQFQLIAYIKCFFSITIVLVYIFKQCQCSKLRQNYSRDFFIQQYVKSDLVARIFLKM